MSDQFSNPGVPTRQEQRATVRIQFRVRVAVAARDGGKGDVIEGQVANLSTGGLYVMADRKLPAGSPCQVSFGVHDNGHLHELTIPSRVAHAQGDGMGIQFMEVSGLARALLSRLVNRILYERG
ncbi:MAG: PilZ domain-containing protein [Nitrospirae bacterium]|nr:PilZ domain-containing protein [Nitrospirota bacterium]